jgi:ankyrin repeat protein
MLAISNSQYQTTKSLLQIGANPNISDSYRGESAVISAAINDDPKYLELILKYQGNPNALEKIPTKEGDRVRSTALNAAISYLDLGSFEKVKLLVEAGANINYSNDGPEVYIQNYRLPRLLVKIKWILFYIFYKTVPIII